MMKNTLSWALLLGAWFLLFNACEEVTPDYPQDADRAEFMPQSMKKLPAVIVHDIFSPPVASRIYGYPSVAAYEVLRHDHPKHQSLSGQLNDLASPPAPVEGQEYCYPLAALHAFLETGKTLIFSEPLIEEYQDSLYAEFQAMRLPRAVYARSLAYGAAVSQHILSWADRDLYKQTRTYPKYTIPADPAKWNPPPPDYKDGIEPAWSELRLMVLDSASQFAPPPPTPFSTDENSRIMEETREVYSAVKDAREEERAIAKYRDCNPYVSHHTGHVMYATKKPWRPTLAHPSRYLTALSAAGTKSTAAVWSAPKRSSTPTSTRAGYPSSRRHPSPNTPAGTASSAVRLPWPSPSCTERTLPLRILPRRSTACLPVLTLPSSRLPRRRP